MAKGVIVNFSQEILAETDRAESILSEVRAKVASAAQEIKMGDETFTKLMKALTLKRSNVETVFKEAIKEKSTEMDSLMKRLALEESKFREVFEEMDTRVQELVGFNDIL